MRTAVVALVLGSAACGNAAPAPPVAAVEPSSGPVCVEVVFTNADAERLSLLPPNEPATSEERRAIERLVELGLVERVPGERFAQTVTARASARGTISVVVRGAAVRIEADSAGLAADACDDAVALANENRHSGAAFANEWLSDEVVARQEALDAARAELSELEREYGAQVVRERQVATWQHELQRARGARAEALRQTLFESNLREVNAERLLRTVEHEQRLLELLRRREAEATAEAASAVTPEIGCRRVSCSER